jgi:hypothetical protein
MIVLLTLYGISLIICLYIAYYIFKDNWNEYLAGGAAETIVMIFVGFIPILNTLFAILIGGEHLIKKLKKKQ